jgi:hypothetical protein
MLEAEVMKENLPPWGSFRYPGWRIQDRTDVTVQHLPESAVPGSVRSHQGEREKNEYS